ncbi:hypothetical protein DSO57_1011850 [Entomophthora muscae]|uniref:Uncharacterized protein n=1 Tax=Entomophthora muscae TaxID=34485 RepID=A0ACC2S7X4_9FUNG|nr:hypothetical protein DSO57_1011850 [Entomophthora muscae]
MVPAAVPWALVGQSASYLIKLAPLLWWALPSSQQSKLAAEANRPSPGTRYPETASKVLQQARECMLHQEAEASSRMSPSHLQYILEWESLQDVPNKINGVCTANSNEDHWVKVEQLGILVGSYLDASSPCFSPRSASCNIRNKQFIKFLSSHTTGGDNATALPHDKCSWRKT